MRNRVRGIAAVLALPLAIGLAVAPAGPAQAKAIKCKTTLSYNSKTKKATAKVVNLNGTGTKAAVHSFVFVHSDGDGLWTRVYDKRTNKGRGYGPSLTINAKSGKSARPYQAYAYQAGTRCTTGGVTNAG